MTIPQLATLLVWMAWGASWAVASLWANRTEKRVGAARQSRYQALTIAAWVCLFAYLSPARAGVLAPLFRPLWQAPSAIGWALVLVVGAAAGFGWWGRVHLGRLWSAAVTRKADHRVVDRGPYAIVRHPIYTALIVGSSATALGRGTPLALIGAMLFAVGYHAKARIEERFLGEELGPDYGRYQSRVPMLLPLGAR